MKNIYCVAVLLISLLTTAMVSAQAKPETQAAASPAVKTIALPDSVLQLRQLASKAYQQKKYRAFVKIMEKLHNIRPLDTDYMYQLALAYSLVDDKRSAYNMMLTLQREGAAYDFDANEGFKNLRGTEVYEHLNDLMVRASEPAGVVEDVLTLADDVVLPEAIDWDPMNQSFLVGTIPDGKILRLTEDGKSSTVFQADADNGMWSIFDIKVDHERKVFWVSTAALPGFKDYQQKDYGRSALFKFDLESGKLLQRLPMAVDGNPHSFANLALGVDGSIYIADSQAPVIYVLKPGATTPQLLAAAPSLLSIRSLVLNKDNTFLYLSDYVKGLFVLNLKTGQMRKPRMPESLNTSGVDGMYKWKDSLVVIQNGFNPSRVLRLQLDEEGVEIIDMAPLAVAQPIFDNPNFGVVREDWLYYFANSHWGYVDASGNTPKPVSIVRTKIDEALNVVTPDMDLFMESVKKQKQMQKQESN